MKKTRIVSCFAIGILLFSLLFTVGANAAEGATEDYDAYYLQNGLTLLSSFYDGDASDTGAVSAVGLWQSANDGRGITFEVPTVYGAQSTGLTLTLPSGHYTLEAVAEPYGMRDEESGEPYLTDSSPRVANAFSFGGLKTAAYPAYGSINQCRTVYYYYGTVGSIGTHLTFSRFFDTAAAGEALTLGVSRTLDADGEHYTLYGNGRSETVLSIPAQQTVESSACRLFYGFPATVYAVRVYDRVLSAAEMAHNHLVDLFAYHRLPISLVRESLSEEEWQALAEELSTVSVTAKRETVATAVSARLYALADAENAAFGRVARAHRLDILSFLSNERNAAAVQALAALDGREGLSSTAVQQYFDLLLTGEDVYGALIVFDRFAPDRVENAPVLEAVFRVNTGLLQILELTESFSFGTMVGYADAYTDAASLVLDEEGSVGEHAARYLAYQTGDSRPEEISFRVVWDAAYQTREGYGEAVLFRAWLKTADGVRYIDTSEKVLPRASMLEAAKYFVCHYDGTEQEIYAYNADEGLRAVLWACSVANIPTILPTEDEMRLEELKAQLAEGLAEAMQVEAVRYCGRYYEKYDENAIWIEYLDTNQAGVDGDARIRPAYIYFPTYVDPTSYSNETQMKNMGILRVFGYIGTPTTASMYPNMTFPGIVCVHGGGGHAYINYVKEAVNHGYFAIAIDTDGFTRSNPTAADSAGGYVLDTLGMKKDSLENSHADMTEQWQYYVQRALIYCNTVLRSFTQVDEDAVGITGISWGGFAVTTNIQYDYRYAFAVPVYLSSFIAESEALSLGSIKSSAFVAALWQDTERLSRVQMPVLLLNGDGDPYASLNTTLRTYYAIPGAEMCISHGLTHSQQKGASQSEIYLFGNRCLGIGNGLPQFDSTASGSSDREYTLTVRENSRLSQYSAVLYYQTEPIAYNGGTEYATCKPRLEWEALPLTVGADGTVEVTVPEEAVVYYVAVTAYNASEKQMPAVYYTYTGNVTTTTPLIPVGCEEMYALN